MPVILEGDIPVREKIFRTAVEFFLQYGYKNVSLRQIAREVGIAHNTILHYFGSKEGLASEFNYRSRKLLFEKAEEFYETIPPEECAPEMGLLAYHLLLYKLTTADRRFGQTYLALRTSAEQLMLEENDCSFFTDNMTKLFPGFHYKSLSAQDFQIGLSVMNNCTLVFLYYLLNGQTTIRKTLVDYFRIYTYFLLDVAYPDTFAADFFDRYQEAACIDPAQFQQELLSFKSYY